MAMDSAREQSHHQEINSETLESMLSSTKAQQEKKPRPAENSLKCPRCESSNTKFCYYNNYSLSQPRYFCKSCRRYWTKGGTLRNVPVGGGCRKTKRSSSSSSSSRRTNTHDHPIPLPLNPSYATPAPYDSDLFHKPPPAHPGPDGPGLMSGGDHFGLIEALRGGFLDIPRGFHNVYGGNGNDNGGSFGIEIGAGAGAGFATGMGIGIGVLNQEMGLMGFEDFASGGAAAVKQETNNGERWGLNPWLNVGGEGSIGVGDLDSTRIGSWNGIGSSSWHGLLNSPLV